jgi:hypothetical protein
VDIIATNANRTILRANDIVFDALIASNRALYLRYEALGENNPMTIRAKALATATTNIGNCEAQAALAFDWLARHRESSGVRFPIELWEIGCAGGDDAHVFVVIGRTPGGANTPHTVWNNLAVVCDPWSDDSYPASQLQAHATAINGTLYPYTLGNPQLKLLYRSESNEAWPWNTEPDHAGAVLPVWSD